MEAAKKGTTGFHGFARETRNNTPDAHAAKTSRQPKCQNENIYLENVRRLVR